MFLLWCFSPLQLPGYFSGSFIRDLVLCPMDDCEHPLLYLPGPGMGVSALGSRQRVKSIGDFQRRN